jgi:predicted acyltransferase (DUF342 family)
VFIIKNDGDTDICGHVTIQKTLTVLDDVSMQSNVDIDGDLYVNNKAFFDNDLSINGHIQAFGDVSMASNLEITQDLMVHDKAYFDNDVSMGSHLHVMGDVSMGRNVEISSNLVVYGEVTFYQDISLHSDLEISNNLVVHNDVSMGNHLHVVGDVSLESNLEISNNLIVRNQAFFDKDVSFGTRVQVVGDVSMESNLEISNNLTVRNQVFFDQDVSVGNHFHVTGDVSMQSSLDISNNLFIRGNVGINTLSPKYSLHIDSSNAVLLPVGTSAERPTDLTNGLIRYNTDDQQFEGYIDGKWQEIGTGGAIDDDEDTFITAEKTIDDDHLRFFTDGSENMTIDPSGNVGIHNSNPLYSLHIDSSDAILLPVGTSAERPADLTNGLLRYNTDDNRFEGYIQNQWQALGGGSGAFIKDTDGDTRITAENSNDEDHLRFFTNNVEHMTIDTSGNVGIGFTQPSDSFKLDISGHMHLTGSMIMDSDARIKDNIHIIPNALKSIDSIHGYTYTRNDLADGNQKHVGVIAQEIESVYPELVYENERNTIKSVNYNGLCGILIQCVKELKDENAILKERIQNIEKILHS